MFARITNQGYESLFTGLANPYRVNTLEWEWFNIGRENAILDNEDNVFRW